MKKAITLLLASLFTILLFTNSKVQDENDPNVGFYVDGVKVTELTCYSFKKLTIVVPFKSEYKNFDRFQIGGIFSKDLYFVGHIDKASLLASNLKGKYIVYDLFIERDIVNLKSGPGIEMVTKRGALAFCQKANETEFEFIVNFEGEVITGYEEVYDEGCSCVKKTPKYSPNLIQKLKIPLKNRELKKGMFKNTETMDVNYANGCNPPGTKVDFNTLGK